MLSPAYDIVAHSVYLSGQGHGLAIASGLRKQSLLTLAANRALSNEWEIAEPRLTKLVVETVDQAMSNWPQFIPGLPLTAGHRQRLLTSLHGKSSVTAWRSRKGR